MHIGHLFFKTNGRISRKQWWLSNIAIWLLTTATVLIYQRFGFHDAVYSLAITVTAFWMRVNINIKRMHDHGKSGWWVLFAEIPIIGWVYGFIVFGCLKGDTDENEHGSPAETY